MHLSPCVPRAWPWLTAGPTAWAAVEFAAFDPVDARHAAALRRVAAGVAARPAGRVTAVFAPGRDRDVAYAWLENPRVTPRALRRAQYAATWQRARDLPFVWVAADATDVEVTDRAACKGTGRLGAVGDHRGFVVTSALALAPDGAVLGLVAQDWQARAEGPVGDRHQRPFHAKESYAWVRVERTADAWAATHAPGVDLWWVADRGGDIAAWLHDLRARTRLFTVRACHDRRVVDRDAVRVRAQLAAQPVAGRYDVALRTPGAARVATVSVRYAAVTLQLHHRLAGRTFAVALWAVWVHEDAPPGCEPLDWLLFTSYPVADFGDACLVIRGYQLRWRGEEFHFAWKSGVCDVETTQLRSAAAIQKWGGILASVATRALQLRDAARQTPTVAATTCFTPAEIEAALVLRQPRDAAPVAAVPLGRMVRWVAELGGYTGRSSGGPPGTVTIARGLEQVQTAAKALANLRNRGSPQ